MKDEFFVPGALLRCTCFHTLHAAGRLASDRASADFRENDLIVIVSAHRDECKPYYHDKRTTGLVPCLVLTVLRAGRLERFDLYATLDYVKVPWEWWERLT